MRGKSSALPLTVNSRLRSIIESQVNKVTISSQFKTRLAIIRDGINGKSILRTAKDLNTTRKTVKTWRTRWNESINDLIEASQQNNSVNGKKDYEIVNLILEVLSDRYRPGTPKRITIDQEEQIRALACTRPSEHNIPMTNWTHAMLAHVAMIEGIVDTISSRYVGVILKKMK